jgi:2-dehydro-3-deoxygluconokinase
MKRTVCYGEILLRLSPPDYLRVAQALPGQLDAAFAGAEANVAVAIAQLGGSAEFVSALPANSVGDAAVAVLRGARVGVENILRSETGRCAAYFVETGASQRGGLVLYDRDGSTFSLTGSAAYDWKRILAGAGWFHTTGISAGVSRVAALATQEAVRAARAAGLTVSCDLNFRRKLWRWEPGVTPEELSRRTLAEILPHVDVLLGNAHDIASAIGEELGAEELASVDQHANLARKAARAFPQLRWVAMTLRQNHSASRNCWGALLHRGADGASFLAPRRAGNYEPYVIDTIVDRVGTGDAFAGALIFALENPELADPNRAIAFATAAGCLAHSMRGDFFYCTRAEVEQLMNGDSCGHLSR